MFLFSGKNKKQLEAVFNWLSKVANSRDRILLEQRNRQDVYYFEFPLKYGDKPKKTKNSKESDITFYVKFSSRRPELDKAKWCSIFQSPELEVYENKERFNGHSLPLRFGLSQEAKKQAAQIARLAIENFLYGREQPSSLDFKQLPPYFSENTDLDVALWINGRLRGSCPVENEVFFEGIKKASVRAAYDSRFKPVTSRELNNMRIEITLMSNFSFPISKSIIQGNELVADKGFRLTFKDKVGLFLPEVFNVRRFKDLNEFLNELASEKAEILSSSWQDPKSVNEIFSVDDFIEDPKSEEILNLFGPIIINESASEIEERGNLAADWLIAIQEEDGNFPPIINPLNGSQAQINWPRNAFAGWALIEYASLTNVEKYINSGKKNFAFLQENLSKNLFLKPNNLSLTYAYAGQEAIALFKVTRDKNYYSAAKTFAKAIIDSASQLHFEAITFQQIASFFAELASYEIEFLDEGKKFAQIAKENFENNLKNKTRLNLAAQAELVNTFNKIFVLTKDDYYKDFSLKVASWLLKYQLSQGKNGIFGPFKTDINSDFVYLRGTSKIFEVLTLLREFRKETERALDWILAMQYTEKNTFFVPKEIRQKIIGGFRHDYFNQEAWIDGASHFLLGISRYMFKNKN